MLGRLTIAFMVMLICSCLAKGEPKVPCHFIFGDSLFDSGNNNNLNTNAKSNYSPYGLDFPGRVATGRFTNGRTMADFITKFLGFEEFIAPYSTAMGQDILRGVNYASGSAGILPESGSQLGNRIWMDRQLQNYLITIFQLQRMVQGPVSNYLNKCLYTLNIGSNDYINNYFMPQYYPSKRLFNPHQYAQILITRYRIQLQILYNSGARRLAIFGLGQIGCIPAIVARNNATSCVEEVNQAVNVFNTKLESLVNYFNGFLGGVNFTFINPSALQAPLPIGIITDSTCCKLRSDYMCVPNSAPCANRNIYAFMDGFHPTEVVNELIAANVFSSPMPTPFVRPMSISQLVGS